MSDSHDVVFLDLVGESYRDTTSSTRKLKKDSDDVVIIEESSTKTLNNKTASAFSSRRAEKSKKTIPTVDIIDVESIPSASNAETSLHKTQGGKQNTKASKSTRIEPIVLSSPLESHASQRLPHATSLNSLETARIRRTATPNNAGQSGLYSNTNISARALSVTDNSTGGARTRRIRPGANSSSLSTLTTMGGRRTPNSSAAVLGTGLLTRRSIPQSVRSSASSRPSHATALSRSRRATGNTQTTTVVSDAGNNFQVSTRELTSSRRRNLPLPLPTPTQRRVIPNSIRRRLERRTNISRQMLESLSTAISGEAAGAQLVTQQSSSTPEDSDLALARALQEQQYTAYQSGSFFGLQQQMMGIMGNEFAGILQRSLNLENRFNNRSLFVRDEGN